MRKQDDVEDALFWGDRYVDIYEPNKALQSCEVSSAKNKVNITISSTNNFKKNYSFLSRSGFARIAIETNAVVVPVAAIGATDCVPVLGDADFSWLYGHYRDMPKTR